MKSMVDILNFVTPSSALEFFGRFADYKSAIRQITNLRYEVALCAKHIRSPRLPSVPRFARQNR